MPNSFLYQQTVLFQTIQFSTEFNCQKHFYFKLFSLVKQFQFKQFSFSLAYVRSLNVKTVLFQAIQLSISTQFSSIWPIDQVLPCRPE